MKQLRILQSDFSSMKRHLISENSINSLSIALCGTLIIEGQISYMVNKIVNVPSNLDDKSFQEILIDLNIDRNEYLLITQSFLPNSNAVDYCRIINNFFDQKINLINSVMFEDGKIQAYIENQTKELIDKIVVIGDCIVYYSHPVNPSPLVDEEIHQKNIQTFGLYTSKLLKEMTITVVGCSGTGSPVIEQLVRLGVGEIVLVDFDVVEFKNLNRILNTSVEDANNAIFKVDALASKIESMGLGTKITRITQNICTSQEALKKIASTDFIFGCSDSTECRDVLNRLSTYYLVPYIDIGVVLIPDNIGGIKKIAGAVHYVIPKGSSLHTRGVYTMEEVDVEVQKRQNPTHYEQMKNEGYIRGLTTENSPAVISVNMFAASTAVNEFLNRIHPYKSMDGNETRAIHFSISDNYMEYNDGGEKDAFLESLAGKGDQDVFLGLIGL